MMLDSNELKEYFYILTVRYRTPTKIGYASIEGKAMVPPGSSRPTLLADAKQQLRMGNPKMDEDTEMMVLFFSIEPVIAA